MAKQLTDLTFPQWLAFVFEHPVTKPEWYWDIENDWWDGDSLDTVRFLTQAFENVGTVFQPYTDAQLNQGLWFVVSNACSNYMFAFLDVNISWGERQRGLRSIHTLYEQCFAKRCTPTLGHLDESNANPLNLVCYMWWDIIPFYGKPAEVDTDNRIEFDQECLNVMESTLHLDSIACQESALHGLGHWQLYYPDRSRAIIDEYLQTHPHIREPLKTYALSARRGMVL